MAMRDTLRQRQPTLVSLYMSARLYDHAKAIAKLDWTDLHLAKATLRAAADAAWGVLQAAAWAAKAAVTAIAAAEAAAEAAEAVGEEEDQGGKYIH